MRFPELKRIDVDTFVRNCTDPSIQKNGDDWAAFKITRILKGDSFKYDFWMPCRGQHTRIDMTNSNICLAELARQCASRIVIRLPNDRCTLVPVPNSHATPKNMDFRTLEHARSIAALNTENIRAAPMLLWSSPQEKSHLGGRSRSYTEHLENLVVNGTTTRKIVLYDDVVTTGSQLIASQIKLRQAGFEVAGMVAIVAILDKDGVTHSDICTWQTVQRSYLAP